MNRPSIVVVGSSNTDLVVKTSRMPQRGETVLGGDLVMVPGGKGANQAVAMSKLGAEVYLVARVGKDLFGDNSLSNLEKEGVNTQFVVQEEEAPSGVALIIVEEQGENTIVVAPGANMRLSPQDVEQAYSVISRAQALVVQWEIPLESIEWALKLARKAGVMRVVNPAPARKLINPALFAVDVMTPNEKEAGLLTGIEIKDFTSVKRAAEIIHQKGVKKVIITLGIRGALYLTDHEVGIIPAYQVEAVDTTAAGDAFTGGLTFALAEGKSLISAIEYAHAVAAISVTRLGAQPSLPMREEVEAFLKNPPPLRNESWN